MVHVIVVKLFVVVVGLKLRSKTFASFISQLFDRIFFYIWLTKKYVKFFYLFNFFKHKAIVVATHDLVVAILLLVIAESEKRERKKKK